MASGATVSRSKLWVLSGLAAAAVGGAALVTAGVAGAESGTAQRRRVRRCVPSLAARRGMALLASFSCEDISKVETWVHRTGSPPLAADAEHQRLDGVAAGPARGGAGGGRQRGSGEVAEGAGRPQLRTLTAGRPCSPGSRLVERTRPLLVTPGHLTARRLLSTASRWAGRPGRPDPRAGTRPAWRMTAPRPGRCVPTGSAACHLAAPSVARGWCSSSRTNPRSPMSSAVIWNATATGWRWNAAAARRWRRSAAIARSPWCSTSGFRTLDGIVICQQLRAADDWTPILFVTARDDDADRILGLEVGADDYLVKPFNPRELMARLRSVLRRSQSRGGRPDAAGRRRPARPRAAPGLGRRCRDRCHRNGVQPAGAT